MENEKKGIIGTIGTIANGFKESTRAAHEISKENFKRKKRQRNKDMTS